MIEQPFCRVESSIVKGAKFWWLYHFCQLLIPVQNNVKLFFGKLALKFARSIPKLGQFRIPILSLIGAISLVKTFQELFNFDLLFKIGIFSIL